MGLFVIRKNKKKLFFHSINFNSFQNMKKIPWNCIYSEISFDQFSVRNSRTPAFNAASSKETVVV